MAANFSGVSTPYAASAEAPRAEEVATVTQAAVEALVVTTADAASNTLELSVTAQVPNQSAVSIAEDAEDVAPTTRAAVEPTVVRAADAATSTPELNVSAAISTASEHESQEARPYALQEAEFVVTGTQPHEVVGSATFVAEMAEPALSKVESRLETLLEQQNLLLSRQLAVAEETQQRADSAVHFQEPDAILKSLDPSIRKVFKLWRSDFLTQLRCYEELKSKSAAYEDAVSRGELIRPFSEEAARAWKWPAFYRQLATPLECAHLSCGQVIAAPIVAGNVDVQYDIDMALQALKTRHAQEAQAFVLAHHMRCLQMMETSEITLGRQTEILLCKVEEWEASCTASCRPNIKQHVVLQAKLFVDLIFRQEMCKVQARLQAPPAGQLLAAPEVTLFVRCACALMLLFSVFYIDHDVLERVFAIFIAVLCGASLVWEDVIVRCMKTVFGEKSMRLRNPTEVISDLWRTY